MTHFFVEIMPDSCQGMGYFVGKDKLSGLTAFKYDLFFLVLRYKMQGKMKKLLVFLVGTALCVACQSSDNNVTSVFTGNQSTYALQQASAYSISGTVTFKERKDGATTILI